MALLLLLLAAGACEDSAPAQLHDSSTLQAGRDAASGVMADAAAVDAPTRDATVHLDDASLSRVDASEGPMADEDASVEPQSDAAITEPVDAAAPTLDAALGTTDSGFVPLPECTDGNVQNLPCGANDRGWSTRACTGGKWGSWNECIDDDVCKDGALQSTSCGPGATAIIETKCVEGAWVTGFCRLPAQDCIGDVVVEDRADFELYSLCKTISGSLQIDWNLEPRATDLVWQNLTAIASDLEIVRSDIEMRFAVLTQISGHVQISNTYTGSFSAEQLVAVGGDFEISNMPRVAAIDGFDALHMVGGDMRLFGLDDLIVLSLPSLQTVGGSLWIGDFATAGGTNLTTLDGLSSLESIGASLVLCGNVWLKDISALANITELGGDLLLRYNFQLNDLTPLSGIQHVPGDLMVGHLVGPVVFNYSAGNPADQTSLSGLHRIQTVGGDIHIGDVVLTSLNELASLEAIGGDLILEELGGTFTKLTAPPSLAMLGGSLIVHDIQTLNVIDFDIVEVPGDISLTRLSHVFSLDFPILERVGGKLTLDCMAYYRDDADAPRHMRFALLEEAGAIDLLDVGAVAAVDAFPELRTVAGDLTIWVSSNDTFGRVIPFTDFEKLESIGGDLEISMRSIGTFSGFQLLETIDGSMRWRGAAKGAPWWQQDSDLRVVEAFQQLQSVESLEIGGFRSLPECWAEDLVDQLWPVVDPMAELWSLPACTR